MWFSDHHSNNRRNQIQSQINIQKKNPAESSSPGSAVYVPEVLEEFVISGSHTEEHFITDETTVPAREASEDDLLVVHTKRYLSKLKVHRWVFSLIQTWKILNIIK